MNFDLKKLAPWNWFKKEQETGVGGKHLPVLTTGQIERPSTALMMEPFYELHRQMDRLISEAFRGFGNFAPAFPGEFSGVLRPSLDIEEGEKEYRITMEIPGVEEKDVELVLDDGVLYIRGQKHREESRTKGAYHCVERSYGSFQRALNLPQDADENAISAKFKNGVLTVTLPKRAVTEKPGARTIPITG